MAGTQRVKPGVEVLLESSSALKAVKGKRIGLITNPSGVDSSLRSTIDLLHAHPGIELAALFGPEHGIRGDVFAGKKVEDAVDPKTAVKVHSLYGATRRPLPEWLAELDAMVYDIQDVGATSYTYIATMAYAMEACGEAGIPFVVLDRPNPCGADYVDGPVLDSRCHSSFVGLYDIAYMYGMTPGETAKLFNAAFNATQCELIVIEMEGYERSMRQADTGLPFVPTSTQIPWANSAIYYSMTGIIGELNRGVSIGIGYTLPFECLAAPWIDREELLDALRARNLPGVLFRPISYTPKYASYANAPCHGVHIHLVDERAVRPVTIQMHLMETLQRLYPAPIEVTDDQGEKRQLSLFDDKLARPTLFDKVLANDHVRTMILDGHSAEEILATFQARRQAFEKLRAEHLIY